MGGHGADRFGRLFGGRCRSAVDGGDDRDRSATHDRCVDDDQLDVDIDDEYVDQHDSSDNDDATARGAGARRALGRRRIA